MAIARFRLTSLVSRALSLLWSAAHQRYARVGEQGNPFLGELEYPGGEEFVPFVDGEAPWRQAGAEMPEELARLEEERGEG